MPTIYTRFYGPTNYKGARITAKLSTARWDRKGDRVTVPYTYNGTTLEAHTKAVSALLKKLGWQYVEPWLDKPLYNKPWAVGESPDGRGYVFVMSGQDEVKP